MQSMLKATKNKGRAKSAKDKARNSPSQPVAITKALISNPNISRQAGEGLYLKLTSHQKQIATQIKFIMSALDSGGGQSSGGQSQYRSRHNKTDLTSVVTSLLVQLDCAVTTTHQCLTKDTMDKDSSIKPQLEEYENRMYQSVAFVVRWIDFDSKGAGREMPEDKNKITGTINKFEVALAEVVRLVYQCHLQNGTASTPANHQRRSSMDSGVNNTVQRQNSSGLDSPGSGVGAEDFALRGHPTVEQLRSDSLRKSSWAPGSNSPLHGAFRGKSNTLMPFHHSRDSGLSEGSSGGASDDEKRRSGSSDHYLSGGQSPEHSAHHLRESMSPDWDSNRTRSMTTPIDSIHGGLTPIPIAAPLAPEPPSSSLPPLPGEVYDTPPPLPQREDEEVRGEPRPPVPVKKVATLPRVLMDQHMNGHSSPDTNSDLSFGAVEPVPVDGRAEELPPPIPIKKRHMSMQINQPNGIANHLRALSGDDTAPPPLPTKVRRGQRASISSPITTPTHAAFRHTNYLDVLSSVHSPDYTGQAASLPPVPMRMESILPPSVKTVLGQDTPPAKPPRNDRPEVRPSPKPAASQELEALNAVKKYNEDILKAKERGEDELPPPIPLKKKTIMIYKGLVEGYTFDESYVQPLYIPGMDAPPPIPPKRRKLRNKQPARDQSSSSPSDSATSQRQDTLSRQSGESKRNSSADDTEEIDVEVNHLELEDAQGYLIFKEGGGGYTLNGGPVDALISYAASSAKSVKHFSEAFLLTYSTFITAGELINKLLYRLTYFYKSNTVAVWQASTSLLVRVLTGLKQSLDKEIQVELIDLVHKMITHGNLKFAQILRNALVDKLNQLITEKSSSLTLGMAFRTTAQRKSSIMDFSAESIAKQMTILDNELFQKVDVCEMLYWAKEQNEEKSPMLTQFTLHFNNVSQWTKVTLLKKGLEMKVRCKIMNHFIAIMKSLLDSFNNFNSYLAILSAIESSPISRLDWPDKVLKGLEEPRKLIDNRASFKNYREAFSQAKPPCIPYIGLYLQDLTFIEMQPSKLAEDPAAINFTKRWQQFKSVDHIRFAQTKQYNFDPDPELLSLFKNFEVKETDEDLWAISTEIKPSQRNRTH